MYLEKSNLQRQKVGWWYSELGIGRNGGSLFNVSNFSWEDEKILDMNDGDGFTIM